MYRVVLVDDESVSLRFLHNYISGYCPQFEIVGEFDTGLDALNFFRENNADLVITDVKMPIMNGIELAKCLRRLHSSIHIVIVSGYAEFDFAKGALEAEVDTYLLKPLSLPNMEKALSDIEQKLSMEYEATRSSLLAELLHGTNVQAAEIDRYFHSKTCFAAMMRMGNLQPRSHRSRLNSPPAFNFTVPEHAHILEGRDSAEHILISTHPLNHATFSSLGEQDACFTAIFDSCLTPFSQLCDRVQEFYRLLDGNVVMGQRRILETKEAHLRDFPRMPPSELRKIDYALTSGNSELMQRTFMDWGKSWDKRTFPQLWVEKAVQQIIERFLTHVPALQSRQLQVTEEIDQSFVQAQCATELMRRLWELLYETIPQSEEPKRSPEKLFQQIQEYIEKNYSEPLTLQSVCAVTGISQAYLGKLFRKYSDKTFNEMLISCRMENAKRLIGENSDIPLNDIASIVGYDSQSYFCKVFKQYTSMTPGQYIKANTENDS